MTSKQKTHPGRSILNRRAHYDYTLGEEIVAGLELTGQEVRAARDGLVQLKGAFVSIRDSQLWLNNASFSLRLNERGNTNERTVDTRSRRLLVHRKQIEALSRQKQQGATIVPLKLLTNGRYIKLVIAPGKGKKQYDKRESIKRRDQSREAKKSIAASI